MIWKRKKTKSVTERIKNESKEIVKYKDIDLPKFYNFVFISEKLECEESQNIKNAAASLVNKTRSLISLINLKSSEIVKHGPQSETNCNGSFQLSTIISSSAC